MSEPLKEVSFEYINVVHPTPEQSFGQEAFCSLYQRIILRLSKGHDLFHWFSGLVIGDIHFQQRAQHFTVSCEGFLFLPFKRWLRLYQNTWVQGDSVLIHEDAREPHGRSLVGFILVARWHERRNNGDDWMGSKGSKIMVFISTWRHLAHFTIVRVTWWLYRFFVLAKRYYQKPRSSL